ncbi:winged helix-turn-helix transcriptional regulator [Rhodococcus opacus]|uniref:winged helix-turn-helix transcriptional regulator n=1 Tax=Rhodococcus opacus TaxID=37919 RepID=UPI001C48766B|nr:helix-turn-helix domain-containing protein [Rhodococcus opacus]MBV6755491.1 helix-turn-helix transcriptional regulator [Rhodococcus opacus]
MSATQPAMPRLDSDTDGWMPSVAYCPVSLGTRLIGDRWSLLIVREMLVGASRFNAIHRAMPGLSRTLLSSRLRYLERIGVVDHVVDGGRHGARSEYKLTQSGLALRPVLEALGTWTSQWQLPPTGDGELGAASLLWHMHRGLDRTTLPKRELTIGFRFPHSEPSTGWIYVGEFDSGACTGFPEREIDLTVIVEPTILGELWWGKRTCAAAIAAGDVGFEGPTDLASAYPGWFRRPTPRS